MANGANQNPANKVGRNSGGGAVGISEAVPSPREAERGLEPVRTEGGNGTVAYALPREVRAAVGRDRTGVLRAALGTAALVGAGVATYLTRRARQPRTRMQRARHWVDARLGR